ncbi:hypothetical protein P9273_32080, partial [Mesorhizobium sp. WSM4935]|uniref:hypothetical protein n=1 Tax=Mesorhizobium sp. WSM4935 TaxID=3038547 RepID=UPI002414D546
NVLADKAQVDSVIELVYKNASEEDVEADKAQRAVIAAAYECQRFHEASLAAQTLREHHELRSQSREAIGKVAQPLEKVVRLLTSNKDLISH